MTSSAWHWHLLNREAWQVGRAFSCSWAPWCISVVFHPQVAWERRVDFLSTVHMNTGAQERAVPPMSSPRRSPLRRKVQGSPTA